MYYAVKFKEKKRQLFLKTTSDGRQRARQKRMDEELQREKQNKLEEAKRLYVILPIWIFYEVLFDLYFFGTYKLKCVQVIKQSLM